MYKLDSGFISIIATIAAIAIGVYSSINDKKKAQVRRKLQEDDLSRGAGEDALQGNLIRNTSEEEEPAVKMFNNPFEELFKAFKEEQTLQAQQRDERMVYGEESDEDDLFDFVSEEPQAVVVPVQPEPISVPKPGIGQEKEVQAADEYRYDNGLESIENSGISLMNMSRESSSEFAFMEPEEAQPKESLRERIKKSPKDLVLFAEVLRPKYQEF